MKCVDSQDEDPTIYYSRFGYRQFYLLSWRECFRLLFLASAAQPDSVVSNWLMEVPKLVSDC